MANLPAHTRNYWTRANVPFGSNNSSQLITEGFTAWAFVHLLLDLLTTGTEGGTRHANSIWICRGSSDGAGAGGAVSAVGVAGTNRWWNGGTFPGLVRGANGSNHHWMLLENVALGYECLVNFSQSDTYLCVALAKTGTFTGGSATNTPTAAVTSKVVNLGQAGYNTTDIGQTSIFGDTSTNGQTRYAHITVADTGEFFFLASRAGLGGFTTAFAAWKSTGADVADTENLFVLSCTGDSSGRGSLKAGQVSSTNFCASRQPSGAQKSAGGVVCSQTAGANMVMDIGADAITGLIDAEEMKIKETAPSAYRRGTLPDLYMCGNETVGAPIPASGATQIRTVVGNLIVPFIEVQPIV